MKTLLSILVVILLSLFIGCDPIKEDPSTPQPVKYQIHHQRIIEHTVHKDSSWLTMDTILVETSNMGFQRLGDPSFNCSFDSVYVREDTLLIQSSNHGFSIGDKFECLDSTYDLFSIKDGHYISTVSPTKSYQDSLVRNPKIKMYGDTLTFIMTTIQNYSASSEKDQIPEWFGSYGDEFPLDSLQDVINNPPTGVSIKWYGRSEHQFFYIKN